VEGRRLGFYQRHILAFKLIIFSSLGIALQYTLKRWQKLNVYTQEGFWPIGNKLLKNSINLLQLVDATGSLHAATKQHKEAP